MPVTTDITDTNTLCACGCGEFPKHGNKWINGHNIRLIAGRPMSDSAKSKMIAKKRGFKHSEETKKRISEKLKGIRKGKMSQEHKHNIAKARIGTHLSGLTRKKISEKHKGKALRGSGWTRSLEERKRVSESMKAKWKDPEYIIKVTGPNAPNWKGGIAAEPYCDAWLDKEFKQSILERDNFVCQNPDCWKTAKERPLVIHHIDYNKKNCSPKNLITLCASCNTRANFNRWYWRITYEEMMGWGVLGKDCAGNYGS